MNPNTTPIQGTLKTNCGKTYDPRYLKPMAKTKPGTGIKHFILFETPDEFYIKYSVPVNHDVEKQHAAPAVVISSEEFYNIILEDYIEILDYKTTELIN